MARKPKEVVGLRLRMPVGLHRLLIASAKKNNRSLNSEVLWALATVLGGEEFTAEAQAKELTKRFIEEAIEKRLAKERRG